MFRQPAAGRTFPDNACTAEKSPGLLGKLLEACRRPSQQCKSCCEVACLKSCRRQVNEQRSVRKKLAKRSRLCLKYICKQIRKLSFLATSGQLFRLASRDYAEPPWNLPGRSLHPGKVVQAKSLGKKVVKKLFRLPAAGQTFPDNACTAEK